MGGGREVREEDRSWGDERCVGLCACLLDLD